MVEKQILIFLDRFFRLGYTTKDISKFCTNVVPGLSYKRFGEGVKFLNILGAFDANYTYRPYFDLEGALEKENKKIFILNLSLEEYLRFENICRRNKGTYSEALIELMDCLEDKFSKQDLYLYYKNQCKNINVPHSLKECEENNFQYTTDILEPLIEEYYCLDKFNDVSGIYGLYNGDKLCYIGRSIDCKERFFAHMLSTLSPYYHSGASKVVEYIKDNGQTLFGKILESMPKNIEAQKRIERYGIEKEQPFLNTMYVTKKVSEGKYI